MSGISVGTHTFALLLSHCQGGMEMQCTSYLSGYCQAGDLNVGANGKRWSLYNNFIWKGGQVYNNLLTPTVANQELEDYKEALRQMMLKHEATFKDQVRELHCLYWRQREIMNELRLELSERPSQSQTSLPNTFPSQMPSKFAKEARLVRGFPGLNASSGRVSFLMESLQSSSSFVGANSIVAIPVISLTNNTSEDCILLSSKSKTSGKRVLDLELPADEYIDSEEGEQLEGERVCEVPDLSYHTPNCISQFHPNIQLKSFLCGGRSTSASQVGVSRINADSQETCDLFDLNEPIQLEAAARMEVSHQDQNFSRDPSSSFQYLTERVVLPGKELEIHADNAHVVKDRQCELLSYSDVIGKNGSNLNFLQQHSSSKNSPQPSCAEKMNAEVKFSERNHVIFSENHLKSADSSIRTSNQLASLCDTAKSELSSVLCQRTVTRTPIAVQALPCCNAPVVTYDNKSPLNGNSICSVQPSPPPGSELGSPTTSSSLNIMECVNDKKFTSKHRDLPTSFKVTSCTDTDAAKGIDLNSIPVGWSPGTTETQEMKFDFGEENYTNIFRDFHWLKNKNHKHKSCDLDELEPFSEQDLSTRASSSSHKNPSESNDTENSGKASIPAEHLPHDVAFNLAKCDKGEQDLEDRIHDKLATYVNHIDLNSCTNEDESSLTTLDASIKTENLVEIGVEESMDKKCSLLGEESEEHQHRTSLQLSEKNVKKQQEDDVRIAAEAIVSISSSGVQPVLEKTPFGAFCECLYWFAGIVSYMENDKGLGTVLNGVADSDCDELLPKGIDYFEAKTLMLTETKTEDVMSTTSNAPEVKETDDNLLPSKPSRGQMMRGRRRKDFQTVVLPSLASLSRYEVREDLHLIGGLMQAAGTGLDTSLARRNAVKTVGKRGRRGSGFAPSSGVDNTMCSLPRQQSHGIEIQVGKGGLTGWGKNNKRQRAQRPSTRQRSRN